MRFASNLLVFELKTIKSWVACERGAHMYYERIKEEGFQKIRYASDTT